MLAVADSGHNRVIVARAESDGADVVAVAGTGVRDLRGGAK
ncbi:MAG TPA: hypothetical protein VHF46_03100 [Rubrobacteraceae bacterium]|nr:hypothetical protein [Rubrobacteraceae bacterium]